MARQCRERAARYPRPTPGCAARRGAASPQGLPAGLRLAHLPQGATAGGLFHAKETIMRLVLLSALLLLAACKSPPVDHDFDASRDFAAYRSWKWLEPAVQYRPNDPRLKSDLTDQRVRQAVAAQLDQRGLRP